MNLLDANVWFAGMWDGHIGHARAARWRATGEGQHAMCRVTQMAVLRLLSNPSAMGAATLTRRQAWSLMTRQLADPSVVWLAEPEGIEDLWRWFSALDDRSHKVWTDDYLAAFAQVTEARLVTFDRALAARYPSVDVETI